MLEEEDVRAFARKHKSWDVDVARNGSRKRGRTFDGRRMNVSCACVQGAVNVGNFVVMCHASRIFMCMLSLAELQIKSKSPLLRFYVFL